MRKIVINVFLLLLTSGGVLQAQTLTVLDQQTLQPLEFVSLYSPAPRVTAVTDGQGQVDLTPFKGADSIYFRLIGYETAVHSYAELRERDFSLLMQESRLTLQEVVVSANRWEQDRREVPFKISVLRAREVAFQQPQTAADLLGVSGDVFIQKSQLGGGSPMIRGFSANRVLLVIDGVRMNNAIFRSGNLQNVISLDPHSVQNAEVIFGPSSVIYGSDAIGGVMDFHTLLPKLSSGENNLFGANALLRYSSANAEKTGHFDLNFGKRKWAFVSSVSFSDYGDLTMGSNGPEEYRREAYVDRIDGKDVVVTNGNPNEQVPSGYNQFNMLQRIRFRPNDAWDFNYGFHFSTTSDVPRYDRLIEQEDGQFRSAEWFYGPQRWLMNNLQVQHQREAGIFDQMRLVMAHQAYRESRNDRRFGRTILRNRTETVNALSLNLDFDKQLSETWALFYGAEAIFNHIGSEAEVEDIVAGETEPTSTRYPDGSTWSSYAAYASLKANLSEQLTLLTGARFNLVDVDAPFDRTFFDFPFERAELTNGALTGTAGLTYRPESSWQFNLNLSTGFRSPNIDDVGKVFDSEPGSVVVPNPDLQAEYAYSADIGVVRTFGDRFRIDATAFYTLLDNALVRRDYQFGGQDSIVYDGTRSQVQAIQNAAQTRVWGLQGGLEWDLPAGFSLSSRISWQDGEEEEQGSEATVPVRHVAPWFGTTHLIYKRDRLKADFYAVYNGEIAYADLAPSERGKPQIYAVDSTGNPYSPGWYTLNIKASYQLNPALQLNLGLENITDQRYRPYSSGIAAPGRNVIVALRGSF